MKDIKNEYIFDLMKNKDPKGFELMYEYHFRTMYGIAFTIVRDETISYDVVQNVMVKLYRLEQDKFPVSNELSWIYRVTKNEALQLLRKEKPSINIDSIPDLKEQRSSIDKFTDMDAYYNLIKPLNEKQQKIVTLKMLGGLTHREISKMINIPMGTIQWIYSTSIKKLRLLLTAITTLIITSGALFSSRVLNYYRSLGNIPEIDPPPEIPIGNDVILTGLLFALSIVALIIFFKKSENIPTN